MLAVKKFVEKASKKQHTGHNINSLKQEDLKPNLAFHYGVPTFATTLAYDPIQHILAISTKDGRVKLVNAKDNTQTLLQSDSAVPSKFLQFLDNQGILLNVTVENHIEVWNIVQRQLCYVHILKEEITSFTAVQQTSYMYVGNSHGNISVLKMDWDPQSLVAMQYIIPSAESHGTEVDQDNSVIHILPQPMAESNRVLIIFKDGLLCLWGIKESKVMYIAGGNLQHVIQSEPKNVVSACWVCPIGSKVAVGYSNGEIFLWAIAVLSDQKTVPLTDKKEIPPPSKIPLIKLNLGYKLEKMPIVSLRWVVGDGKASRLYINGFSNLNSSHSFQVVVLNESTESRMIKMTLPLSETCLAMEIISCFDVRNKPAQNALVLLLKSGRLCLYDDSEIEQYLSQCQSKSPPSLPNQVTVKLPFVDSSITVSKLYTCNSASSSHTDEDLILVANKHSYLLSLKKDENHIVPTRFNGFSKIKNIYVTGHVDGSINFWDASCPLLIPILSLEKQNDEGSQSSGSQVTALHFDIASQILVYGDRNGLVCIITFKKEQTASENILSFLHGKQEGNYTIQNVKLKGSILSFAIKPESNYLAIGTEKGFVSMVDIETLNVLFQKQFPSHLYTGVISLQFESCSLDGYAKEALLVGIEDSSVFVVEEETGNGLSTTGVHPKKPSRALLTQTLASGDTSNEPASPRKQSLLLVCSENAVRLYSLYHAAQGIKKSYGKKKLNGTCCYASVVYSRVSDIALMLIFISGKIEIRSLPDLSLLKESMLRGFMNQLEKTNQSHIGALASSEGELVAVNGDKEILFFSLFPQKDIYRNIEYINNVYKKDVVTPQEGHPYVSNVHKEKKKGLFSMGSKSKHSPETNIEDSRAKFEEELSLTFSIANFVLDAQKRDSSVKTDEDVELDIDDIDIDDTKEKPKGQNFAMLNTQNLGKKFLAITGKLKLKTDEKANLGKEKQEDDKASGSVDDIKKKYGYSVTSDSSVPKMAEKKLSENIRKLEGINERASDMGNTAQTFSSMAKDLLRSVQR